MAARDIQRLVERAQKSLDGRSAVKLRTVLTAFGYARRSAEGVDDIRQQLSVAGIDVDLSVSSPATLDERVVLRRHVPLPAQPSSQAEAGLPDDSPAGTTPPAAQALDDRPGLLTELRPPPNAIPAGPPPRELAPSSVRVDPLPSPSGHAASIQAGEPALSQPGLNAATQRNSDQNPSAEPARALARRLFRTARTLFWSDPPIALPRGEDSARAAPPGAVGPPTPADTPPVAGTDFPECAAISRLPGVDVVAPAARIDAEISITPELSHVAEQTILATVLVEVDGGFGSGFLVHRDGLVVTACHVLEGASGIAKRATIRLNDGRESTASLVRAHRALDFALLWLDKVDTYPVLPVGNAEKTRFAETVLAVGHPGVSDGMGQVRALRNTVSTGIVANPRCTERGIDWIQMTTDIDQGNSGGPLVNSRGEVIGVNCWKFLKVAAAKMALPIDYLNDDLSAVIEHGRGRLTSGRVCAICGWFDEAPSLWFCPTCGVADSTSPELAQETI